MLSIGVVLKSKWCNASMCRVQFLITCIVYVSMDMIAVFVSLADWVDRSKKTVLEETGMGSDNIK